MFNDLAFVDWLALLLSSVLIAAAAVSALLAYSAGRSQRGPLFRLADSGRLWADDVFRLGRRSPAHADQSVSKPLRTSPVGAHAAVSPAHADTAPPDRPVAANELSHDDEEHMLAVAARAARLAGRPVPDVPPAKTRSVTAAPEPLVYGSSLVLTGERTHRQKRSDFDVIDGFKARTPGFFEDPLGRHELRYWDGHQWTEYVKERGERFTDPL